MLIVNLILMHDCVSCAINVKSFDTPVLLLLTIFTNVLDRYVVINGTETDVLLTISGWFEVNDNNDNSEDILGTTMINSNWFSNYFS